MKQRLLLLLFILTVAFLAAAGVVFMMSRANTNSGEDKIENRFLSSDSLSDVDVIDSLGGSIIFSNCFIDESSVATGDHRGNVCLWKIGTKDPVAKYEFEGISTVYSLMGVTRHPQR